MFQGQKTKDNMEDSRLAGTRWKRQFIRSSDEDFGAFEVKSGSSICIVSVFWVPVFHTILDWDEVKTYAQLTQRSIQRWVLRANPSSDAAVITVRSQSKVSARTRRTASHQEAVRLVYRTIYIKLSRSRFFTHSLTFFDRKKPQSLFWVSRFDFHH